MALQNFVDFRTPVIGADWLNRVDSAREVFIMPTDPEFGAVGDNSVDDSAAFQACFAAAKARGQLRVHIPEGRYALGAKITISGSFDITCDKSASMRWTNPLDCGLYFDFNVSPNTLCSIELPQLFGPAITSAYLIPGYSAGEGWDYDLASRVGSAVHIRGGDRISLYVHYAAGWEKAIQLVPSTTKTCDNYDIRLGVADFVTRGLSVENAGVGSLGTAQLNFRANTIWAKFPLYLATGNGYIISSKFEVDGVFVNEDGGCVVYNTGTALKGSTIRVNWIDAGRRADSVPATPVDLRCPYLGGNQTSNGLSNDGMGTSSDIGYFGSKHCDISFGAPFDYIGTDLGSGSPIPAAGHTIRIRDNGRGNIVKVLYADYETSLTNVAIELSSVQGEANYNGGVGGAQFARTVYTKATITALAPGASLWLYGYHQLITASDFKPIAIVLRNELPLDDDIAIAAFPNSAVNREFQVRVKNNGAGAFTGELFFWLVFP